MGIVGVKDIEVTRLKRIPVDGGDVLHALKSTDQSYIKFGEAYFSIIDKNVIKAWKRHMRMTLNIVVPTGAVQFAFVDKNENLREEILGNDNYARLTVPPNIWFGFRGLDKNPSIILNIADILHDPAEVERKEVDQIKFNWEMKK